MKLAQVQRESVQWEDEESRCRFVSGVSVSKARPAHPPGPKQVRFSSSLEACCEFCRAASAEPGCRYFSREQLTGACILMHEPEDFVRNSGVESGWPI